MIGIFDSGSGGLSVLSALRERAPKADIVYFGDIGNAPYGSRSPEELAGFVQAGMKRFADRGIGEVVAACNSISFSILLGATGHDRLIEMTRPAARMLRKHAGEKVLLLATQATIDSGIYREALWSIVSLDELPVPKLAHAIETGASEAVIAQIIREALTTRQNQTYDRVLLGCTHYPLVADIIEREVEALFGPVPLIDPAHAVADEVLKRFDVQGSGMLQFIISHDSHEFRNRIAPLFLESPCTLEVV